MGADLIFFETSFDKIRSARLWARLRKYMEGYLSIDVDDPETHQAVALPNFVRGDRHTSIQGKPAHGVLLSMTQENLARNTKSLQRSSPSPRRGSSSSRRSRPSPSRPTTPRTTSSSGLPPRRCVGRRLKKRSPASTTRSTEGDPSPQLRGACLPFSRGLLAKGALTLCHATKHLMCQVPSSFITMCLLENDVAN